MAIIPLAQSLPIGSSDLPGSFGRAALITLPYLVLHREEFAWPRMSPHAPVRSYSFSNLEFQFETSPYGPHRFTHHLRFRFEISKSDSRRLVYSLLHLSSPVPSRLKFQNSNLRLEMIGRPAVSGLAALWCSDFPLPRISIPIPNRKLRFQREAAITRPAPNCKAAGL